MRSCFVSTVNPAEGEEVGVPEIGLRNGALEEVWCSACDLNAECLEAREMEASVDAFERGVNFIDTANVYSGGRAEEFLGEVLRGRPRDSYVLATKLYFPMSETDRGLSAAQVRKQ